MAKCLAVSLTSGMNCGESAASLSKRRTAVTTFVLTPQAAWTLTQTHLRRVTPYLWSNHRSKRLDEKPLLSMAKLLSTARRGIAVRAINCFRIGVYSGFSWKEFTLAPGIGFMV